MREMNRLGVTGVIDAGGGFQNYPDDYEVIQTLDKEKKLTLRIAYNLFTQRPGHELDDFEHWTQISKYQQGNEYYRHNGAGEMLVFSAADFEDFLQERPDLPSQMEEQLKPVVQVLAKNQWPFRLHATYDESITRALTVYEEINAEIPIDKLHWFFDHAETISEHSIERVKKLGGGIVHADEEFLHYNPPLPPISPSWSPVKFYGTYNQNKSLLAARVSHAHVHSRTKCTHHHGSSWQWGSCFCWAF